MIALKRILVPTDFSETSEAAVKYGVALARAFKARLFLLHAVAHRDFETIVEGERVVEKSLGERTASPHQPSLDEIIQSAAREQLGKILTEQEKKEIEAEYVLRASGPGGPYVEIVRYAQERDIDLIVMGTHGRGFVAHLLMGNVAEKVVRKAPCPVLTVHHPEHEFVMPEAAGQPKVKSQPAKSDLCLRQKADGNWSVFQGADERIPPVPGVHLTDWERAKEIGQDIASYERVDLWAYESGRYVLVNPRQADQEM